jgi:hypothetical protein
MEGKEVPAAPVARVGNARPLSLQNEALLAAGQAMLANSIEVGRDICKTMITVCSGAIPIHVALIGLAAGKDFDFDFLTGLLALAGPAFYLAGVGAFAYGYFPGRGVISLENVDSISSARDATIDRRYKWASIGMVLFGIGVIATLAATMYLFSLPAPIPAQSPNG